MARKNKLIYKKLLWDHNRAKRIKFDQSKKKSLKHNDEP